jgi:hypothetical protein
VAYIYKAATLVPSKADLLRSMISSRSWAAGAGPGPLALVGAYRFDDPDGQVGMETHLVEVGEGKVLQIPFTYRSAVIPGGEEFLVAIAEHSVLGTRWIYDGLRDPVFLTALATCIICGGRQADLENISDTGSERRESGTKKSGTKVSGTKVSGTGLDSVPPSLLGSAFYSQVGATTIIRCGALEITVFGEPEVRQPEVGQPEVSSSIQVSDEAKRLLGTWPGQDEPTVLALAQYS